MIAADPRYRSVGLQWTNNEQTGTELVELFARALGGGWSLVRSIAVGITEQLATWDTAAPLTFYDLAMRYVNGSVPGAGYESEDPDDWTASTAPGAKTSVTTSSEAVAWAAAMVTPAIATLNWTSAQQNAPYLLEISTDGGATYTDVAVDLVATNYAYTIPAPQANTTVRFRLTAQRGGIVGPTAGTLDVFLGQSIGVPSLEFITSPNNGGSGFPGSLYVSWSKPVPAALAQFVQWQFSTDNGATYTQGPIASMNAPAVDDVAPQPDGYKPVQMVDGTGIVVVLPNETLIQVRLGITSGSSITWGAWVAGAYGLAQSALLPNAPVTTIGALSSAVTATQTISSAGDPPPTSTRGAVFFDTNVTQPLAWGMMKVPTPVGTNSYTLNFPSTWHGQSLFLTGIAMHIRPDLVPPAWHGYLHTGPARTAAGTVP